MASRIEYSEKYGDGEYEYRYVANLIAFVLHSSGSLALV